eukprot:CAMPEP_0115033372 /NCGR_PEP_ID=MMETSP0216-20121206/39821_1 /TAXON_ID=223996 /ORGANISM="Protocruzia adherens, Strain Boccale" /LENGTH=52 /DNA_ID=CAMNT_0002411663 /DNA_START=29 /DNA_END=183 /DNA_ORIENTATION=+
MSSPQPDFLKNVDRSRRRGGFGGGLLVVDDGADKLEVPSSSRSRFALRAPSG